MKYSHTVLAGLLLNLLAVNTQAAVNINETIIVTATKTAQIADETLAPVIVITHQDIERSQTTDVADLLKFHAGLDIGRNGGPGQASSLFIRGTESNHVLVLIDGIKINAATVGGVAFQNILPDNIERIEIVKGPRSSLYGSEAIGGVINIITQHPEKNDYTLTADLGRYNNRHIAASVNRTYDTLRVGANLAYLNTDGFPAKISSALDHGHDNTSVNLFLGTQLDAIDIEASFWQAQGNTAYIGTDPATFAAIDPSDQDFLNSSVGIKASTALSSSWFSKATLGYALDEIDQNQSNDFAHTRRFTLDWQNDITLSNQQLLTAGLYLSRENADSLSFGTAFDKNTDINAAYLQDDVWIKKHHVLASARYTHHSNFGNHTTWNIDYGYALNSKTRLTSGIGTAFRAPDAADRFGFGGNPHLNPETSLNIELGIHHKIDNHQHLSVSIFNNTIKDLVTFNDPDGFSGPIPGKNINLGQANINGIEATYQISQEQWGASLSAISQNPEDDTTGKLLLRRAEHSLTTSAYYQLKKFKITGDFIASSQRKDTGTSFNKGYGLLNLGLIGTMNKNLQLFIKAENVLDKKYQLASGFNTAERSVFAGIKYQSE